MFGNSLMPHCLKNNIPKVNGMFESELKLDGDILLPERSRYDKDLREKKGLKSIRSLVFRKERSSCLRLMNFEIGSRIFLSNLLSPRSMISSLDEAEELRNSIEPERLFPRRSRYPKKGIVKREEGMVPEK
ncbi:hypothetical protein AALP_AA3G338100 [Arabis alpina]|uniref:Uncharacterized protein n=1 Tax=Arabis alpina TaxID=50452 RepID=A0A087HDF7_ARAAL|nr:hypothetical protein AALP_AA3G338100 [Arabis alpina]